MVYLCLILGFICLIYGGDTLVTGSVKLARRMGVSPLLIGLTLVGFGTSTPELITSLLAVYKGSADIAVGNVIGSNTANILLVLGVAIVLNPIPVDLKAFKRDGLFLFIATLGLIIGVYLGEIHFLLGLILTGTLLFYVVYSYFSDKKAQSSLKSENEISDEKQSRWIVALLQTIIGIGLTLLGAKLLVDSAIELAKQWQVSEKVIGLTIVAVGTSLPELITSIMAGIRKQNDVAFGNVLGSNIYNALFILGVTALFMPIHIANGLKQDLWMMVATTLALIAIALLKKNFSRLTGILFLVAYVLYTLFLFCARQGGL